jgi:hypothetical protein
MDLHYFIKQGPDLDPHQIEMLDPEQDPFLKSKFSGCRGSKMEPGRAVDVHNSGVEAKH